MSPMGVAESTKTFDSSKLPAGGAARPPAFFLPAAWRIWRITRQRTAHARTRPRVSTYVR